jgi:hypothetical protein
MSAVFSVPASWQVGFLAVLPAVKTHAKFEFRHLPAVHREEAVAEAIAAAVVSYQRLAVQGRLHVAHPSSLAKFAVKAVRNGRRVGGNQAVNDLTSPIAHRRHGIQYVTGPTSPADNRDDWLSAVIADKKAAVPDLVAIKMDFGSWLKTLAHRDRRIIAALASRERTHVVAERFGLSEGRVSQLRRKFEELWRVFQGEAEVVAG